MSIQVADAEQHEIEGLIEIYSSHPLYHGREKSDWFVRCFYDYHHIKVLRHGTKVIGAAFWSMKEEKHHGVAEIVELWFDENFRRKESGERLLRVVIDDIKQHFVNCAYHLRKVVVTTGSDNEPAKRLYEKIGFQSVAVLKDLFGQGENELVHILAINP